MPLESFERILPALKRTELLHLQGWGEPFLHPDLFEMAALAKGAGCKVATTTNGMLLDESSIALLLDHRFDFVAFSLAGTSEINDRLRKGSRISRVLQSIRNLNQAKIERGLDRPALSIAYMLLKSCLSELTALPQLLKGTGVSDIIISTLDFVPSKELDSEVLSLSDSPQGNQASSILEETYAKCSELGIQVHYPKPTSFVSYLGCSENVHRSLFVSSDGSVSPCAFRNIPGSEKVDTDDGRKLTFGNVNVESLPSIWRKHNYRKFRNSHYTVDLPKVCRDCPKLRLV
jgi:radical SAM protein with 4Fe4S-binding SPASM domain